tara:strand:+ start:2847 stop:4304 length:1458 start_codon:yes stop_codon:yes gene_type:complete
MKSIYKNIGLILIILVGLTTVMSCSDYLDINVAPDSPSDAQVTESVILPNVLAELSYELSGGYVARASSLWTAQIATTGEGRNISTLFLDDTDVNNTWQFSLYTGILKDAKLIEQKAIETGNTQYLGISKVIQAYGLSIVADLWNEAPWSEAYDLEIIKPKFDTQEELYNSIDQLLEAAITDIDSAITSGKIVYEDLLYNGDLNKWKKLAYSLRARFAMRLIYAKGDSQADLVLLYASNGFTSNDDDAGFAFEDKEDANNPWVQWADKWTDVYINTFIVDLLGLNTDPRLDAYALNNRSTQTITGAQNGTTIQSTSTSYVSIEKNLGTLNGQSYFMKNTSNIKWMSYSELLFLVSEAYLFKQDAPNAQINLRNAIKANLDELASNGILALTSTQIINFSDGFELPASFENSQKMIIEQKYIANFLQIEPYNDYRRTGYPDIPLPVANYSSQIPERFPYGTNSILNNADNVPVVNYQTDKVWWDQK